MAELTKEQIADYKRTFTSWYRTIMKKDIAVPAAIMKEALKQRMPAAQFKDYIRRNDKNWLNTTEAMVRRRDLTDLIKQSLGPDAAKYVQSNKFEKLAEKYMRADPGKTNLLRGIFRNIIMKSPAFQKIHPAFKSWFDRNFQQLMSGVPVNAWMKQYSDEFDAAKKSYQELWSSVMGAGEKVPDALVNTAFSNDWSADSPEFVKAVQDGSWETSAPATEGTGATSFDTGVYATARNKEFAAKWTDIFGDSVPVDAALMKKYARSSDEFEPFFEKEIKDSTAFRQAFPDFSDFEAAMHSQGDRDVDIWDYFDKRTSFIEDYREAFGDDKIDAATLSRAMREGWSTATFHKYVMENDTRAADTTEYKNKAASFDQYWREIFGENAVVDPNLRSRYVTSGLASPTQMWNDIKGTAQFKEQYRDWDVFSNAQTAAGNTTLVQDPAKYKEYQMAISDAWARYGMQMPEGYHRTFFSTGMTPEEVEYNLEQYTKANQSYQWATGQKADVVTAAGSANKVAGGDLRERMRKALEQHKQYAASDFNKFRTDESEQGNLIRRI